MKKVKVWYSIYWFWWWLPTFLFVGILAKLGIDHLLLGSVTVRHKIWNSTQIACCKFKAITKECCEISYSAIQPSPYESFHNNKRKCKTIFWENVLTLDGVGRVWFGSSSCLFISSSSVSALCVLPRSWEVYEASFCLAAVCSSVRSCR